MSIIINELNICNYETVVRLERRFFTNDPFSKYSLFLLSERVISLRIKVLETNILVNVLGLFLYKMEIRRETKGNKKGQR